MEPEDTNEKWTIFDMSSATSHARQELKVNPIQLTAVKY
jgi:hypothetical protein